jgi:phage tail-like protein
MADTEDVIKSYPLPAYSYKVLIGENAVGFSEVSGLNIEYETITYKESRTDEGAGPLVRHMPGQGTPASVTLKKGFVSDTSLTELYGWISKNKLNITEKKDISIQLIDEEGSATVTWKVINAFPKQLDAPTFSADSSEVAIESMELMADDVVIEEA